CDQGRQDRGVPPTPAQRARCRPARPPLSPGFSSLIRSEPETLLRIVLGDRLDPVEIAEIPVDGLFQPDIKRQRLLPAKLPLDLRAIDGIARVMARPVGNETDQILMRAPVREFAIENTADAAHDIDILALGPPADHIGLPDPPVRHNLLQRGGVILDIEPVADILALAI